MNALTVTILFTLGAAAVFQTTPLYPPIKQSLTESERNVYLAAARKAWIEVDELSDAKPIAACFADHAAAMTPFTLVDKKAATEVVLRFFTARDLDASASTAVNSTVMLSVLLLNDEVLWQGGVDRNPNYRGQDASCQFSDKLAENLRTAMRKARDQK